MLCGCGTIIAWPDEILASHHTNRPPNARIEGINNLLQVLRRTAHGFTNPTNFQARGLLVTQSPQPMPATPHPTLTRSARKSTREDPATGGWFTYPRGL